MQAFDYPTDSSRFRSRSRKPHFYFRESSGIQQTNRPFCSRADSTSVKEVSVIATEEALGENDLRKTHEIK